MQSSRGSDAGQVPTAPCSRQGERPCASSGRVLSVNIHRHQAISSGEARSRRHRRVAKGLRRRATSSGRLWSTLRSRLSCAWRRRRRCPELARRRFQAPPAFGKKRCHLLPDDSGSRGHGVSAPNLPSTGPSADDLNGRSPAVRRELPTPRGGRRGTWKKHDAGLGARRTPGS